MQQQTVSSVTIITVAEEAAIAATVATPAVSQSTWNITDICSKTNMNIVKH